MITITMEQMLAFRNSDDFFSSANIPLKGAYKLNKIKRAIEKESDFYGEKFQDIIEKYAERDEDGNLVFNESGDQITIKPDLIEECNEALVDLQQLEIEIENYNLTIEDFGEDFKCTPEQLEALMPFMA